MRRSAVIICLLLTSYSGWTQTNEEYQALPLLLHRGEQITISYDSAYLITAPRYALYQQLHRYLLDTSAWMVPHELIKTYERALHRSDQAYQQLLRQYQMSDSLSQSAFGITQQALQQADHSLLNTQKSLTEASHGLDQTKQLIRAERRRARKRNALFGAGGVGIGLLVSLFMR